MSVPARKLSTPAPARRAPARRTPARRPGTEPARRATRAPKTASRARRARHHVGFAILASVVIGGIVLGIVTMNVLLAQTSFHIDAVSERVDALAQERLELVRQQAELSAPDRIAAWARRHGMRLPDDIRFLHAPGDASAAPVGTADGSSNGTAP